MSKKPTIIFADESADEPELSFAQQLLAEAEVECDYFSTNFIPPTSVVVESIFSVAGYIWTERRASTLPVHVEEQMFLLTNKNLWDVFTVQKILSMPKEKASKKG